MSQFEFPRPGLPIAESGSDPMNRSWLQWLRDLAQQFFAHRDTTTLNHHPQYVLVADVDDTPVDGATTAPISSNWANDHVAAADPHPGYMLDDGILEGIDSIDFDTPGAMTVGGAPGWRDMIGSSIAKGVGVNDPAWVAFRDGIYAYSFSATLMKELWFIYHVDHDYAAGTDIYLHTHWAVTGVNAGAVRWGFECSIAKGHSQSVFPATTTVYVTQAATGAAYQHMIAETAAISSTELEPDSLILVRVFRDAAHVDDTQTAVAFLLSADIHYQATRLFTKNKSPNFYT